MPHSHRIPFRASYVSPEIRPERNPAVMFLLMRDVAFDLV
jgi:hypothetical protein